MAAFLGHKSISLSRYRDHKFEVRPGSAKVAYRRSVVKGPETELDKALENSATLYVGNLAFVTTEEQIYELFSKAGSVKRVIMGLDKFTKTPCGFCFVEYYDREDAEIAMRYINSTRLDSRVIRTDWDAGFVPGREFGRGRSGGQVRDEYRTDFDPGRGGYGKGAEPRKRRKSSDKFWKDF